MHVLIIEDDLLVALDVVDSLSVLEHCTTSLASTEELAVRAVVNRRPDLIVADLCLAEGRGPDAVRRITETLGEIPVLYVTGHTDDTEVHQLDAEILFKPVERDALIDWCKRMVNFRI